MNSEERQDEQMEEIGFVCQGDYQVPKITSQEYEKISTLIDEALEKLKPSLPNWLDRLAPESFSVYEFLRSYGMAKSEIRRIARELQEENPDLQLPDRDLFSKLDLRYKYQTTVNFVIGDGGEIREKHVYEEDGETVRPGWVRLYIK